MEESTDWGKLSGERICGDGKKSGLELPRLCPGVLEEEAEEVDPVRKRREFWSCGDSVG